jgi:hypothetical protein
LSTEKTANKAVTDIKESIAIEKHLENDLNIKHRRQRENSFEDRVLSFGFFNPKPETQNLKRSPEAKS